MCSHCVVFPLPCNKNITTTTPHSAVLCKDARGSTTHSANTGCNSHRHSSITKKGAERILTTHKLYGCTTLSCSKVKWLHGYQLYWLLSQMRPMILKGILAQTDVWPNGSSKPYTARIRSTPKKATTAKATPQPRTKTPSAVTPFKLVPLHLCKARWYRGADALQVPCYTTRVARHCMLHPAPSAQSPSSKTIF